MKYYGFIEEAAEMGHCIHAADCPGSWACCRCKKMTHGFPMESTRNQITTRPCVRSRWYRLRHRTTGWMMRAHRV